MSDPGEQREAGFYWISVNGQEVEVAQWQHEWDQWFVIGSEIPLSDEIAACVMVLSGPLLPPALPTATD